MMSSSRADIILTEGFQNRLVQGRIECPAVYEFLQQCSAVHINHQYLELRSTRCGALVRPVHRRGSAIRVVFLPLVQHETPCPHLFFLAPISRYTLLVNSSSHGSGE